MKTYGLLPIHFYTGNDFIIHCVSHFNEQSLLNSYLQNAHHSFLDVISGISWHAS